LWNIRNRREVRQLPCQEVLRDVTVTSDGTRAATAGTKGIVRLWNLADGTEIRVFNHGQDNVVQVAFSPDGKLLASGTAGLLGLPPTVRIWDTASGNLDPRFSNVDFLRLIQFTIALEGTVS